MHGQMKMCTLGCVPNISHCTQLNGQIELNIATSYIIIFVIVDLFTHGSKFSKFIQSYMPSNTLLLIPN